MSLDYALAKELKDVGFPQKPKPENPAPWIYLSPTKRVIDGVPEPVFSEEIAYDPTLEELIEACGDFYSLTRVEDKRGIWVVFCGDINTEGYGSTPTEAVARLWLALNKKGA